MATQNQIRRVEKQTEEWKELRTAEQFDSYPKRGTEAPHSLALYVPYL